MKTVERSMAWHGIKEARERLTYCWDMVIVLGYIATKRLYL